MYLLKTLIVGTHWNPLAVEVVTSTHNLCFGSKIRTKLLTPVFNTIQKCGV